MGAIDTFGKAFSMRAAAVFALLSTCASASADSQINLALIGPAGNVSVNQTIDVKLRATQEQLDSLVGQNFVAIDLIIKWDPADLQLIGLTQVGSVSLLSSYFPTPANDYTGINEASPPADGDAIYYALAPLGAPVQVPLTGAQITTFRFKVKRHFDSSQVEILPTLTKLYTADTIVYDGTVPGLDVLGTIAPATITQPCIDGDNDGACVAVDCNDANGAIRPGAPELCSTVGVDNDCDGNSVEIDANAADKAMFYSDGDDDTFTLSTGAPFCPGTTNPGYRPAQSEVFDCNDGDALVYPGAPELCADLATDNDCDGSTAESEASDRTSFFRDADGDGFTGSTTGLFCTMPAGYETTSEGDCNDGSATVYPGATERCADLAVDNDCDGSKAESEAIDRTLFYPDADADGFTGFSSGLYCAAPPGYEAVSEGDCNDASAAVYPGAAELCATPTVDNDCDGDATEIDAGASDKVLYYADIDLDTYTLATGAMFCSGTTQPGYRTAQSAALDCNDGDALVYPGAPELCADLATDNDCDGSTAESEASDRTSFFRDADGDGFTGSTTGLFCTVPSGYETADDGDCDDGSVAVYPGATERCADLAVDNDCDGSTDETEATDRTLFYLDADGDGFTGATSGLYCTAPSGYEATSEGDCDDASAAVYPGAAELCATPAVDNDCDGDTADIDAGAADKVLYFADADLDTYTLATGAMFCPGTTQPGYRTAQSAALDCNDASAAVFPGALELCADAGTDNDCDGAADEVDPGAADKQTFYLDADGDGAGDPLATTLACAAPQGYVATAGDGCPSDSAKFAPGSCGCGIADSDADASGTADCLEVVPALAFDSAIEEFAPGDTMTVRLSLSPTGVVATGVRVAVGFDPSRLAFVSAAPAAGGPFAVEQAETVDPAIGVVRYEAGRAAGAPGTLLGGAVADFVFTVLAADAPCASPSLVVVEADPTWAAGVATEVGVVLAPSASPLDPVWIDGVAPVLTGVPDPIATAADAGTLAGAQIPAPDVAALDDCEGAFAPTVSITYPDGSTGTAWPTGGWFPIGTSVVVWSAEDRVGNAATASRQIAVANHQLLDASFALVGSVRGNATRSMRITAAGVSSVVDVAYAGAAGSAAGVVVPVRASYPCLTAKDVVHSVTDSAAASVSGRRWSASFSLHQGDSNDDNVVDVLDFGIFVGDIGLSAPEGVSNFNADIVVNNADFSYISLNFTRTGETCGAFDGPAPRTRISVKELRRLGQGDAVAGDLNRDGWLDERDIQYFLQHGNTPAGGPQAPVDVNPGQSDW